MYLRWLKFEGLKRLADTTINFLNPDGTPRMWTVLLGENGACKTTLLQAIALAAAGQDDAKFLVQPTGIAASLKARHRKKALLIEAEFEFSLEHHSHREYPGLKEKPKAPPHLQARVTLPSPREIVGISEWVGLESTEANPLHRARAEGHSHWFIAGYGVNRQLPPPSGAQPVESLLDRLRPLFDQRPLTSLGFAEQFNGQARLFNALVAKTLLQVGRHSGPDSLLHDIVQIERRGRPSPKKSRTEHWMTGHLFSMKIGTETVKLPAAWLSAGYQSTIAWVADLIGQVMFEAGEGIEPQQIEGIVLLDEVDLHLHPRWQVQVVRTLRATFPRVQFVATTHSAMVLTGLYPQEVLRLDEGEDGNIQVEAPGLPTRARTSDGLLRDFFDLPGLYPKEDARDARVQGELASNPQRSEAEEAEVQDLTRRLEARGVPVVRILPRQP